MRHILVLVIAVALTVPPSAIRQKCCTGKRAKGTTAKSKEAKAAAQLGRARLLLGPGKKKQAIKRFRNIVSRYAKAKAAVQAMITLSFTSP
jgi:hypothetical protein